MDHNYRESKYSSEDPVQPEKTFIGELFLNQVRKEEDVGRTKEGITKVTASRATGPDESTQSEDCQSYISKTDRQTDGCV